MTDRPRYTAPMPDVLHHQMRAGAHPARSVPCPHCKARAHQSCHLRKSGRELPAPHAIRVTDWARTTACCPECQVEPGITCRTPTGIPLAASTPAGADNPPWSPVDTTAAATLLHDTYQITRKPADLEQRLTDLPMPVVVSRHQCPFCRRYTRADVRQVQDHMGRCWQNPALRCCKACVHHQDGSHPEDDESCIHPDGPEWEDYRFPVLHCPLWQAATA